MSFFKRSEKIKKTKSVILSDDDLDKKMDILKKGIQVKDSTLHDVLIESLKQIRLTYWGRQVLSDVPETLRVCVPKKYENRRFNALSKGGYFGYMIVFRKDFLTEPRAKLFAHEMRHACQKKAGISNLAGLSVSQAMNVSYFKEVDTAVQDVLISMELGVYDEYISPVCQKVQTQFKKLLLKKGMSATVQNQIAPWIYKQFLQPNALGFASEGWNKSYIWQANAHTRYWLDDLTKKGNESLYQTMVSFLSKRFHVEQEPLLSHQFSDFESYKTQYTFNYLQKKNLSYSCLEEDYPVIKRISHNARYNFSKLQKSLQPERN